MIESTAGAAPSPSEREVAFTRFFVAPRAFVFDLWTRRQHLERWWIPEDAALTRCQVDTRPGGELRLAWRDAGGKEHAFHATFGEAARPLLLSFTAEPEDAPGDLLATTVTFDEMGAMTRMTVHQAIAHAEPYGHEQLADWLERLTRMMEYVEGT